MKIFISHSSRDIGIYNELAEGLKQNGYTILSVNRVNVGESVIEKIKCALNDADILIAIITENFLNSSWAQAELSSVILSTNNIRILPVVVGDVFVPNFLIQFQYRKVDSAKEITKAVLNDIDRLREIESDSTLFQKQSTVQPERKDTEEKITLLKNALVDNQLTLVCGAGVSRDSSIPDWNNLLVNILNEVFFNDDSNVSRSKVLAEDLLSLMPQSNLILGKYLRLVLKNDFDIVPYGKKGKYMELMRCLYSMYMDFYQIKGR